MYRVVIKKPAKKFIDKLPRDEKRRVVDAIESSLMVKTLSA